MTETSRRCMGQAIALVIVFGHAVSAYGQDEASEWRYYGGDAASTKYSALDQIDSSNAGDLEIVWRWKMDNFGPRPEFNSRVTPIMVGGVLYTTAGYRRAVAAIDAATGETLWVYRIDEGARGENAPRLNSGRGVAYWTDGRDERILLITPGYHMISLNATTGQPDPEFGRDGIVDLKQGLDRPLDLEGARIGSSSPPIVVNDVVVVGASLPQGGAPPTKEMPPGHVRGFDVRTGERLWIFHTIPQPSEFGNESWENDSWRFTGNGGVWTTMSADLELGYVYLPTELGTGDYYGGHRPGDNLFSQSLVCLDARTGERVWHFQLVHHGIWDYDLPAAPVLGDIVVDGREIRAVAQVTKQGFTYVFDRVTGEPVWPIVERAVPPSDVPGERAAPTQPFPTKPAPFDRQGVSADDLFDLTPELHAEALEIASHYRTGQLFTAPSRIDSLGTQGTLNLPGSLGGANWPGAAFDPETGMLYVPSSTNPTVLGLASNPESSNMNYISGSRSYRPSGQGGPQGLPLIKPPWGRITAIDLNTAEHVWMVANNDTPEFVRDHPALAGVDVPRTGRPTRAGLLVTKTLLFAGDGGSGGFGASLPSKLRAHDKATGEIIAEVKLPANQTGVPMTYMVDGYQYIVLAVGSPDHPAELVALRLPTERSPQ